MGRICGIEIKASEAILVVLEENGAGVELIDIEPKKIILGDDESVQFINSFFDSFINFVRDNRIDLVVIKKRAKKGKMPGGAISFKIEAIIQLNGIADVIFVSGQGIAAETKKKPFSIPERLNKYQENAFLAVSLHLRKKNR